MCVMFLFKKNVLDCPWVFFYCKTCDFNKRNGGFVFEIFAIACFPQVFVGFKHSPFGGRLGDCFSQKSGLGNSEFGRNVFMIL